MSNYQIKIGIEIADKVCGKHIPRTGNKEDKESFWLCSDLEKRLFSLSELINVSPDWTKDDWAKLSFFAKTAQKELLDMADACEGKK